MAARKFPPGIRDDGECRFTIRCSPQIIEMLDWLAENINPYLDSPSRSSVARWLIRAGYETVYQQVYGKESGGQIPPVGEPPPIVFDPAKFNIATPLKPDFNATVDKNTKIH